MPTLPQADSSRAPQHGSGRVGTAQARRAQRRDSPRRGGARGPYRHSLEHIRDELLGVNLLVHAALHRGALPGLEATPGSPRRRALQDWLRDLAGQEQLPLPSQERRALGRALTALHRQISRRCSASQQEGWFPRLLLLAERFQLTEVEVQLLLLALAPEVDLRYHSLLAELQPETGARRPTMALATALLAWSDEERRVLWRALTADAPLLRQRLLEFCVEEAGPMTPRPAYQLRVEPRVLAYLCEEDTLPAPLLGRVRVHASAAPEQCAAAVSLLDPVIRRRLEALLLEATSSEGSGALLVYLEGVSRLHREALLALLAGASERPVLEVDADGLAEFAPVELQGWLDCLFREAVLRSGLIYLRTLDALSTGRGRVLCEQALQQWRPWMVCEGEGPFPLSRRALPFPVYALRPLLLEAPATSACYAQTLTLAGVTPSQELLRWLNESALSPSQLEEALAAASQCTRLETPEASTPRLSHLLSACRQQTAPGLGKLAARLQTARAWSDLVVCPKTRTLLEELREQLMHRTTVLQGWGFGEQLTASGGFCALFTGAPGTGKTFAASLLGRALERDVYRVDLSMVISKYIGETEKQLAQVFAEAEAGEALLFFDEADALFARRTEVKDSHDRFANLETGYLLQRIESFRGVVVLATNLKSSLDPAFVRRMSFIVPFEEPTSAERLALWQGVWPAALPLASDVRLELLATRFELTGGTIRNAALAAAYRAAAEGTPVSMRHILHAIRREQEKLGRVVDSRLYTLPEQDG